jgi:deoxycytidylate deaminase
MTKDDYYMGLTFEISKASKCLRAKYGSVLVSRDGRIISTGYNGKPRGSCNDHICYREGLPDNARVAISSPMDYRLVPLSQEQFAMVSDIDYEWACGWKWYLSQSGYAVRNRHVDDPVDLSAVIRMHREIVIRSGVVLTSNMDVDHISGNPLDNRRDNLRPCSHMDNQANGKLRTNNTSGFPGVGKKGDKWRAYIKRDGKFKHLGVFDTAEEARDAYRSAANLLFGEFSPVNRSIPLHNCCLHSESNCIGFSSPIDREGGTLYVSGVPCTDCALLIAQSGVSRLVYYDGPSASGHRGNFDFDFYDKYGMRFEVVAWQPSKS